MASPGRPPRPSPPRGAGPADPSSPIDGSTRLYAVIGHPVAHSLSPTMQNAAFRAAGHNAVYGALDVPPPRLAEALAGLHAAGFAGLNVTLPHKEEALRLAHAATPAARDAGAANTLRWTAQGWEAEATDGAGLLAWLERVGLAVEGSRVLLLGAGGAARGVATAIAGRGAALIRIVNRSPARAESVAATVAASAAARIETAPWEGAEALPESREGAFDLVIRALSVEAVSDPERRWWRMLRPGGALLDLNYGSRASRAREEAERMSLRYEDGLQLLVEQGALSFSFWTGAPAPIEAMRQALAAS